MARGDIALFSLAAGRNLATQVASHLGVTCAAHEERRFEDGEFKIRTLESVRARDVYVLQSLYHEPGESVQDKLVKLLFLCGGLRDAGADRVTAVIPYLAYSRKERRTQPRDPVSSRYLAALLEAVGIAVVVTVEVHERAAFDNAFRCRSEHLDIDGLLVSHLVSLLGDQAAVVVASPDIGGVKRAERLRARLSRRLQRPVTAVFVEKHRAGGQVEYGAVSGDVTGRKVVLIDDMIATGGTLARAAQALTARGAAEVYAAAAHGLFTGDAGSVLAAAPLRQVLVTDSIPHWRLGEDALGGRLVTLSIAPLLASAIDRLHQGGSLSDLLAE
jgi:ribose-phosphate pyrophosphokinase